MTRPTVGKLKGNEAQQPSFEAVFPPEALQACLTRPRFLPVSAVSEHVPFLFWLVTSLQPHRVAVLGADDGMAHFAFCQMLGAEQEAACLGIGQWDGTVPRDLRSHEAMLYDGRSRFVAVTNRAEIVPHIRSFGPDLLFVDLAALPQDGIAGLVSKALDGVAVAVLHGGEPDDAELQALIAANPHVEFPWGEGMVVLSLGGEIPPGLELLFAHVMQGRLVGGAELILRHAGAGVAQTALAAYRSNVIEHAEAALVKTEADLATSRKSLEDLKAAHEQRSRKLAEAQAELYDQQRMAEQLAAESAQASAIRFRETTTLVRLSEDLRNQIRMTEKQVQAVEARLQSAEKRTDDIGKERDREMRAVQRGRELELRLRQRADKLEAEGRKLRDRVKQAEARIEGLQRSFSWRVTAPLRRIRRLVRRK